MDDGWNEDLKEIVENEPKRAIPARGKKNKFDINTRKGVGTNNWAGHLQEMPLPLDLSSSDAIDPISFKVSSGKEECD